MCLKMGAENLFFPVFSRFSPSPPAHLSPPRYVLFAMPSFTFTPEHGYVILSSTAMCFYLALSGGLYVGRSKIFGKEWVNKKEVQELKAIHDKEVGTVFSTSGYPDHGSGLYSKTLSYSQWYKFSNMQRAHYNLIEGFPAALGLQAIAGIYFPKTAAALSLVWIGARHVWATNYM